VAYQHVSERPQAPSDRKPEVTPELDRVVLYGLAKDRAKRFQSASEFRDALRLAANGQMPKLVLQQPETVLFTGGNEVTESDLALRQLAEGGGGARTQSRPPVMWTWAAILTIGAIIIAVVFWLVTLAPQTFLPDTSREVPQLVDLEREAAITLLSEHDLTAIPIEQTSDDIAAGHIISTDPEAGTMLSRGDKVTLYVSTGPVTAEVPDIDRMNAEDYKQTLADLGLTVGLVTSVDDPLSPANRVLEVIPAPGTELQSGSSVELRISSGKVQIPEVIGQPLDIARSMIDGLGLDVTYTPDTCPSQGNYPVNGQTLMGEQQQGSSVEIKYCAA
jgi:serine/threonine-protein kinase